MNLLSIQLIVVPFAIFMVYVSFIHYKKHHILRESFIFWILLWIAFVIIAFYPQLIDPISRRFHFLRTLDFLMVIAFMILAIMNYNNYLSQQKLERDMEKLITKLTIVNITKHVKRRKVKKEK